MYHSTETAELADLLLPAAGWGEKEGTFINSERRVGLIKKVRRAPGQALSDFHIFKLAAHYYGCGDLFARVGVARGGLPDPQAALGGPAVRHHAASPTTARSTRRGACSGPTRAENPDPSPQRRLFADGRFYHPDGRARFLFEEPQALARADGRRVTPFSS